MAKTVTIRVYNGTKHEIELVNQFTWCGAFTEPPPTKISAYAEGVCAIKRPSHTDAVGGALVYRVGAQGRDFMVAFDDPDRGLKNMTMTKIGEENHFTTGQVIHDALWAAPANYSLDVDHTDIISLATITVAGGQATCVAVVGDRTIE